ncbi:MAG: UvrD-helicase domain-containing protein [Bacilli bacterium]
MDYESKLNKNQFKAVTSSAQYLRIVAGAGSGKTRVLTYRIAYLIERMNVHPYQILAITFTNKVAKEMLQRTTALIPNYPLNELTISTFHSWCARFLRYEIDALGFPSNFTIMDDEDSLGLIKSIGESYGYKRTDDKNKKALDFIKNQKCYGRLPSEAVYNKFDNNNKEYMKYFEEYEKRKNQMYQLDFDDLLIYTIHILEKDEVIRNKYANRYKDILVDEFQDTNDVQFKILRLLCNENTSVYVVGDPDQTIYTWRGANQGIIMNFEKVFAPTETITLNENYRSTPNILNCANKLISHNIERIPKDLFTEKPNGNEVTLKSFPSSFLESQYIANTIEELKLKDKNLKYNDIVVLYRSNYLTLRLENVLTSKGLPYRIYGGQKFYARKEIKDCLAYFKILFNEKDDISFERIINVPRRKIGDKSISILKVEAENNNLSMMEYLRIIHTKETELSGKIVASLDDLFKKMDDTKSRLVNKNESYSEVLDEFITDIGYKSYLEDNDETKDKLENVTALIDDIRTYLKNNPDSNFTDYLNNIALISSQDEIDDSDSVSLMTAHTAKGLEFKYVFVMCFSEGVFPNQRALNENPHALEEERRLAYVAFTRAMKGLYITYNQEHSYVTHSMLFPSQFIEEAGIKLPRNIFSPLGFPETNTAQPKVYRYDFEGYRNNTPKQSNEVMLGKSNNITWHVGDTAVHEVFGEGKVLGIDGDIIEVDFKDYGRKKLLGNHPKLSKK